CFWASGLSGAPRNTPSSRSMRALTFSGTFLPMISSGARFHFSAVAQVALLYSAQTRCSPAEGFLTTSFSSNRNFSSAASNSWLVSPCTRPVTDARYCQTSDSRTSRYSSASSAPPTSASTASRLLRLVDFLSRQVFQNSALSGPAETEVKATINPNVTSAGTARERSLMSQSPVLQGCT